MKMEILFYALNAIFSPENQHFSKVNLRGRAGSHVFNPGIYGRSFSV